jgi:hypothetical protein
MKPVVGVRSQRIGAAERGLEVEGDRPLAACRGRDDPAVKRDDQPAATEWNELRASAS